MAGPVHRADFQDRQVPRNMKRQREDDGDAVCGVQTTQVFTYQSPLRAGPQRAAWAAFAAPQGHAQGTQQHITPIKRQRDRSVPMDAMSRLMSAATSAARMKKRAQMTLTGLFGGVAPKTAEVTGCCSVCVTANAKANVNANAVPLSQLQRCTHCERAMGPCCSNECVGCASAFCSNCSTINCDEQYDRVFCLSCHFDISR